MKKQIESYIIKSVKTGIFGLFLALVIGLFVREFTRSLKQTVSLNDFNAVNSFLELAHGHGLIFFSIIPLSLALIFYILKNNFKEEISFRKLSIYTGLMHLGLFLTLLLMLYKGIAYVQKYQTIHDLSKIDSSLFGGNHAVRLLTYAVAHIAMTIGLFGIGIFVLKNVKVK